MSQLLDLRGADEIFPGASRDAARAGEALAAASRRASAGHAAEAQRLVERAARLVPARLMAQRDESVSLVWPDAP